ncbi:MAG: hypothetical protein K9N07_01075 [Candidatus Cloacimonetes bacterium]|nr:hypothetical protein [Candidatus Cloacimonadota bacterium]
MNKSLCYLLLPIIFIGCAINKNVKSEPNFISETNFLLAQEALHQHDLENAIKLYGNAVAADSNNVYLKEIYLQSLALKTVFEPSANKDVIKVGDAFAKAGVISEKIFYIIANAYYDAEQYNLAEKFYKKAINTEPNMNNLFEYYYFLLKTENKTQKQLLEKAIKMPWDNEQLVLNIAEQIHEYDPPGSFEILERAYKKWQNEAALTSLIRMHEKVGSKDMILELIQSHIDQDRTLSEPLFTYLIGNYFNQQRYNKVVENKDLCFEFNSYDSVKYLFYSAIKLQEYITGIQAGLIIEESGEIAEEFKPSFFCSLADLYLSINDFDMALNYLGKSNDVQAMLAYFIDNKLRANPEKKSKILQLFSQFQEVSPEKGDLLLGIFYTDFDEKVLAMEFLSRLSNEFISQNELEYTVALAILQNTSNVGRAKILLPDVEDTEMNKIIAGMLMTIGRDSLAYELLKEEITLNPKPDVSIFLTCSFLGETYDTKQNLLDLLEIGIDLYPENPDLLNTIGYLIAKYEIEDKYDVASIYLRKALSILPDNEMIWDSLAWLYFKQHKFEQALEAMKIPLSKKVLNSEIAYHIGEIYYSLNEKKKAGEYFKLALELDDEQAAVKFSKERLKEK